MRGIVVPLYDFRPLMEVHQQAGRFVVPGFAKNIRYMERRKIMKRRIKLSIALTLSVVSLSLMRSDQAVNAQNQMRQVADTGVITLGRGQKLRVTVAAGDINGDENVRVRIVRTGYSPGNCSDGGVCKLTVAAQTTSAPILLSPGEALAAEGDIDGADFLVWRTVVISNRRDVEVNALIIDSATGDVVAFQKHWEIIEV